MTETVRGRAFPAGFTWGTATSAHQVEGGNTNNDWWAFEHTPGSGCATPSGDACDSWNRWEEDADLVASLGLDAYRFSVEWSRVEPADGEFSAAALAHYRRQCTGLRARGIEPVITLHHFTTPRWLCERGGWESDLAVERFGRFCTVVSESLAEALAAVCTVNEPNVVAALGWEMGLFPPAKSDPALAGAVTTRLVDAHRVAVEAVRAAAPGVPVGLTVSMMDYQALPGGEVKVAELRRREDVFLDATTGDDFLGVQTYTRMLIGPDGWAGCEESVPVLEMGYELYPAALGHCLRRAWERTGGSVPLLVTENGIATQDDPQRIDYVRQALSGVLDALDEGVDVRGYTYWSLLDNFEWVFGYGPHFGLVAVDRASFERSPKPSAAWFASVVAANALDA